MHPYMSEQLTVLHQRQLREDATKARVVRRKPSWLRRSFSALWRSPDRRRQLGPALIGQSQPQHIEDAVVVD